MSSTSPRHWTRKERYSGVRTAGTCQGMLINRNAMTKEELELMRLQLKVLKSVEQEYAGRTIGNIIQNLESRLKFYEQEGTKP